MSIEFWKRLNNFAGLIAIGVVFGLTAFFANLEIKDLDLWLHLKTGKVILERGYVPDQDVFSCTIAGKPWVNHEWLFQVVVYVIQSLFGFDGLLTMQVTVVIISFLILVFLGYSSERQLIGNFALLLVFLVYISRFTVRPDIFSLLFFSMYIYILSLHIDKRWSVFVITVIQILWTNMHGFFFFGPLFVTIGIVAEGLKRYAPLPYEWNTIGRLSDEEYKRLQTIWIFSLLACCVNPLFIKGAWYPLQVMFQISGDSKLFFKHIQELQPPVTRADIFAINEFVHYKIFIFLSFVSFVFNRRKLDVSALLFWLVFLFFSLGALRNMIFFAFAAYMVVMLNALTIKSEDIVPFQFENPKFKFITGIMVKLLLIHWMINFGLDNAQRGYFDFDTYERKSEYGGVSKRGFPYKAVDFLVANKVKGNFFNDFNSGAYLIGRAYPKIKVFMDGRTELYGSKHFDNYQKIWKDGDKEVFNAYAQTYNLTGAFLNSMNNQLGDSILKLFYENKEWVVVYFDYDAVIFLKDVPANKEVIDRFRIDLSRWESKPLDLHKIGARPLDPFIYLNRAYMLKSLGLIDPLLSELQEALLLTPSSVEIYRLLGFVYSQKKNFQKTFDNFRIAASMDPGHLPTRFNLAQAYEDLGDFDGAIKQCERILEYSPKNPRAIFVMAKLLTKTGKYPEAIKRLDEALAIDPNPVADILLLGDMFYEKKEYNYARQVYEKALVAKKDLAEVHYKLGKTYQDLGNIPDAKKNYDEGLAADANHEGIKNALILLN